VDLKKWRFQSPKINSQQSQSKNGQQQQDSKSNTTIHTDRPGLASTTIDEDINADMMATTPTMVERRDLSLNACIVVVILCVCELVGCEIVG
jgi:hypothetical protein